uniref:Uncharacterized protein LOC114342326 n=1 Tax=Diabrotica virgifera virgifera TaxID=50390 RepID=A0A6P7GU61_DIAVI
MDKSSKPKRSKNPEENKLDLEFRQILCVIKQFIPYVNSNSHLSAYRSWLEKLSSVQTEKANRNRYLIELAKQIKDNVLVYPFHEKPSGVDLEQFTEAESDGELTEEGNSILCDVLCNANNISADSSLIMPKEYSQNVQERQGNVENIGTNDLSCPKMPEESSWLDLTDGDESQTSIQVAQLNGSGDTKKETKSIQFKDDTTTKEVVDGKVPLKNTNFVPADWKDTIEALQMRLTETLNQNEDLKRMLESQNTALSYEVKAREEVEGKLKKSSELFEKQSEIIHVRNEEAFKKFETSVQMELNDVHHSYQIRMEEMKANYEARIAEIKLEFENDKKAKDQEICRLSEIIHQQCTRMSNEITALKTQVESTFNHKPEDKIILLQKCISKMNKFYQKSEKEYLKQIEKLKQDIEFKDKLQLIQMKTQHAELTVQSSVDRQKHIDDIVNNLEVKYIKMLEMHEKQVMESKKIDDERLQYLKDLLEKHNISFKVF